MSSSKAARRPKPALRKKKAPNTTRAASLAKGKRVQPRTKTTHSTATKKRKVSEIEPQVEVLRRIAAPEPMQENEESAYMVQLAGDIDKAIARGDLARFSPHAQQALIAALTRLYSANNDHGRHFSAIGTQSNVAATDVVVLCGALLKAVDLQVFELGLWLNWSSSR